MPVPQALAHELQAFRRRLGAVAGWVFPGERKLHQPTDRHQFDRWLTVAEQEAKLPKLEGGLWHPYRRKWATERKDLPKTRSPDPTSLCRIEAYQVGTAGFDREAASLTGERRRQHCGGPTTHKKGERSPAFLCVNRDGGI